MRDAGRPGPGRFSSKELGSVVVGANGSGLLPTEEEASIVTTGPMAGELSGEPDKTLSDGRFVIGDYVSCSIFPPMPDGSVAPPPASGSAMRGGRFGGDFAGRGQSRENGFGSYRGRSGPRGGFGGGGGFDQAVPMGEWRRGERLPEGSGPGRGYGGGRGRGRY
jgi:histone deacetylase complex subunit SAP18